MTSFEWCLEIRSDVNWAVQPQKMASSLNFWIQEVEGYRAVDLRLFLQMHKAGFLMTWLILAKLRDTKKDATLSVHMHV